MKRNTLSPASHIWTVVDTDDDSDGNWYAQPGFHIVNKLGYVMTRKPWVDSTPDAIYFLDDFDHEERASVLSREKGVRDNFLTGRREAPRLKLGQVASL